MARQRERPQVVYSRAEIECGRLAKDFYNAWIGERSTISLLGNVIERDDDDDDSEPDDASRADPRARRRIFLG